MGSLPIQIAQAGVQYDSETSAGEAKQRQDLRNSFIANLLAVDADRRGGDQASRIRMQGAQLGAQQRVAYAASGVDTSVGTPAAVAAGTGALTELDAQTALNNAARQAWGYKQQANQFDEQYAQDSKQLSNQQAGTFLQLGGNVMSTLATGGIGSMGGGSPIDDAFNNG